MLTVSGRVVEWMDFYSDYSHFCHRLEKYTNILSMIDKESVILSTVPLFLHRESREILKKCQFLQDSLIYWPLTYNELAE